MKITHYIKSNPNIILILIGICATVYLMLHFQWDFLAITIITLLLGYITNIFTGLVALIGFIPIIGPLIVKVFTIPFFWFINGMGYFTSAYAIKIGIWQRYFKTSFDYSYFISWNCFGIYSRAPDS